MCSYRESEKWVLSRKGIFSVSNVESGLAYVSHSKDSILICQEIYKQMLSQYFACENENEFQ